MANKTMKRMWSEEDITYLIDVECSLDGCVKKEELDTILLDYCTLSHLEEVVEQEESTLTAYVQSYTQEYAYSKSEITTLLRSYVTSIALSQYLEDYYTKDEVDALVETTFPNTTGLIYFTLTSEYSFTITIEEFKKYKGMLIGTGSTQAAVYRPATYVPLAVYEGSPLGVTCQIYYNDTLYYLNVMTSINSNTTVLISITNIQAFLDDQFWLMFVY